MGEKIRDIRPINLIGNDLMVELNEGYTREQGRVIHLQNNKFRYLLTESDFFQIASLIMRAGVEEKYIKTNFKTNTPKERLSIKASSAEEFPFLSELSKQHIEYRILRTGDHIITILIHPKQISETICLIKKRKMKPLPHPYGEKRGYIFLYQMHPFEIYKDSSYYYEIMCQLPCMSLTPKTWIPLDRAVQKALWETKVTKNGLDYVGDEVEWVYRMTKCIFLKRCFDENDKLFFKDKKALLNNETLSEKMKLIVFNFTDELLRLVCEEKFDEIMHSYFSYTNY